ncbi:MULTISPECIES: family 16 glycosylhydrolase [unclassified Fibrobacter]|uniref:glycoside hydrolase family 16 protein n=1 Tax=unclassified Fibrobacter TaxID=2634177 RepID=UPI000D6AC16C|nr:MULTISPECIES: family 16 glycosylhydrolase [unclassified Fibrobacter]PWJ67097.1 glycosyl hydrolase family 16 [Fibrobacter sp. UWR4]PZW70664.1 glycosyl hydrolase family 16 [Fibrobacter sp. UWR1]
MNLKKALAFLAVATVSVMAQNKQYSGAELYSNEEWLYGKYEARMYMGAISGTVSSMFLYNNGSEIADGRPWVEIDIEVLGKNPGSFQSNIITGKAGAQNTSEKHHTVSPAANAGFHTYGLEWTPDYVRWTLDGKEVRKAVKGSQIVNGQDQVAALNKPQGIRFNLWSHEDAGWVGPWDDSKLPVFQFINWVKRYEYTPGKGPDGSDFTLDWTDNFDTFNASRWGKGDWTFDGNRVDLTKNNIYSKEGMLILALTRKGQEMFNGQVPVDNEENSQPQPASSSSQQQNPWQPASSSSQQQNPWQPASSSSQQVLPDAIKNLHEVQLNKKSRGTFNAKGERVNKAGAANYRVDFDLK